jgi:hypothetical protein
METIKSWREARAHLCGRGKPEGSSMLKRILQALLLVVVFSMTFSICRLATAQEWGSIKGRIIVENDPPKLPMINARGLMLPNEKFVLGKNKELANSVVYLRVSASGPPVPIHPAYEAALKKPVVLNLKGFRLVPRIITAREGQTLQLTNVDPVAYNINIPLLNFNQLIPPANTTPTRVDETASMPMPVFCNIQPWVKGYLLALGHPYAAVTGEDGKFEIKNVPAGEREFRLWHESGYLKGAHTRAGETDRRGLIKLNIPSGETLDLGDVKVRL